MTARLKKICRSFAIVFAVVALGVGIFVLYIITHHNFHSVADGRVYRSAQLNGDSLARAVREHGIKTVVNLRGDNGTTDWYQSETNAAHQLGLQHFDFSLSASREVSDQEMEKIVATIEHAPKPVLIHCKNGADRSGLASALYLFALERQSADAADKQLTALYGHIPYLFWRDTVAMDRSYWRYVSNHTQKIPSDPVKSSN